MNFQAHSQCHPNTLTGQVTKSVYVLCPNVRENTANMADQRHPPWVISASSSLE
jgi:hypothetical protein